MKDIILYPIKSEKSSQMEKAGQYVFVVRRDANKTQVKQEVERIFGVKVKGVRIINVKPKKRRFGRNVGFKPSFKKAIVILKEKKHLELK